MPKSASQISKYKGQTWVDHFQLVSETFPSRHYFAAVHEKVYILSNLLEDL